MTRLAGNFAMILLARGGEPARVRERVESAAREAGLTVRFEDAATDREDEPPNAFVTVTGPNRVGILAAVARALAQHGVNIVEMTTQILERTRVPVYLVRIEACVPDEPPSVWEDLRADLARVAVRMDLEIRLDRIEGDDL